MDKFFKIAAVVALVALGSSIWEHAESYLSGAQSAGDILLWADQTIINTGILIMAVMAFSRRLELIWIPILVAAGEAMYDGRLLISGLHSILIMSDTYRDLFGRHGTGQVNPQYAMLTAYLLAFLALSATSFRRGRRSFDRVLVLVFSASVVATFSLFHTFLMVGIKHEAAAEGRALTAALSSPSGDFERQCRILSLDCATVDADDLVAGNLSHVDPLALRTLTDIASQGIDVSRPFVWDGAVDDDASRTTFFIIGVGRGEEDYRIARSRGPYEEATELEGLRYSAQAFAAHATWFGMLCGIVWIHRRHARPRVRKVFSDESFRS
ncbi:hypothetical protein D3C71_157120 [compost metagenome]